jgi:hypothetical protein
MSCASSVLVLCQSVLILCLFCAWHRISRSDKILCQVCTYFVRSCASLCHLFFTSVIGWLIDVALLGDRKISCWLVEVGGGGVVAGCLMRADDDMNDN